MRADARMNHDRLLEVAAEAFTLYGTGASLKAIAQRAGVGIGTLYRRFPTREALVEAVYRNEVAQVCAAAPALLDTLPPLAALRAWMERFVDFMVTKAGMADTLRAVLVSEADVLHTRGLLRDAIATLLDAGVAAGAVRAGVDAYDLLMCLGGVTMVAAGPQERDLALRLVDLLLTGVQGSAGTPGKADDAGWSA